MMFHSVVVILLVSVAAVTAAVTCDLSSDNATTVCNIDSAVDEMTEYNNHMIREKGGIALRIPGAHLAQQISYSPGVLVGVDSSYRSGPCSVSGNATHWSADLHLGTRMLMISFGLMNVQGVDTSCYSRLTDTSLRFKVSVSNDTKCKVSLDKMEVESVGGVEFGSSAPQFDYDNITDYYREEVVPEMNRFMDLFKPAVRFSLKVLCHEFNGEGIVRAIIDSIFH